MKLKTQKRDEAKSRQAIYDQLTVQQKLDRRPGAKETKKLEALLAKASGPVSA